MCFSYTIDRDPEYLSKRFYLNTEDGASGIYNAYAHPLSPVIRVNNRSLSLSNMSWGLIPSWAKDIQEAERLRKITFNARAETILSKPSFKNAVRENRCIIICDGFFEWHHFNGRKYPYYIQRYDAEAFAVAGIWDLWTDPKTAEKHETFSMITTEANSLVARIHNTGKRMPAILSRHDEKRWLSSNISDDEILAVLNPYDDGMMVAWPVARDIRKSNKTISVKDAIKKYTYPELDEQSTLF